MIGSSIPNRFVAERSAAGSMGPRGCEPLVWSPQQRIARSARDWKAPKTSQFAITAAPQKVVSYNVHRGLLTFEIKVPPGSALQGFAQICMSQADALMATPLGFFGASWVNGGTAVVTNVLSYVQQGALSTLEYWLVGTAGSGGVLNVMEQEFYG